MYRLLFASGAILAGGFLGFYFFNIVYTYSAPLLKNANIAREPWRQNIGKTYRGTIRAFDAQKKSFIISTPSEFMLSTSTIDTIDTMVHYDDETTWLSAMYHFQNERLIGQFFDRAAPRVLPDGAVVIMTLDIDSTSPLRAERIRYSLRKDL